jgi:hypothetical protein
MPPVDDATIADDTQCYRRITPHQLVPDDNTGCQRVSSGAFDNEDLSVALGDKIEEDDRTPGSVLVNYPGEYLVSFTAGVARAVAQIIYREPEPDEPAHGIVFGKKKKSVKRALHDACAWVVQPPDACERPNGMPASSGLS